MTVLDYMHDTLTALDEAGSSGLTAVELLAVTGWGGTSNFNAASVGWQSRLRSAVHQGFAIRAIEKASTRKGRPHYRYFITPKGRTDLARGRRSKEQRTGERLARHNSGAAKARDRKEQQEQINVLVALVESADYSSQTPKELRDKKIVQLYKMGMTYEKIGEIFGLSREMIRIIYLRATIICDSCGESWEKQQKQQSPYLCSRCRKEQELIGQVSDPVSYHGALEALGKERVLHVPPEQPGNLRKRHIKTTELPGVPTLSNTEIQAVLVANDSKKEMVTRKDQVLNALSIAGTTGLTSREAYNWLHARDPGISMNTVATSLHYLRKDDKITGKEISKPYPEFRYYAHGFSPREPVQEKQVQVIPDPEPKDISSRLAGQLDYLNDQLARINKRLDAIEGMVAKATRKLDLIESRITS